MNVDLAGIFKEGRNQLNIWKSRYSAEEYPYKVILNMFYRKFTIEKMWDRAMEQSFSNWQNAYEANLIKYSTIAQNEIVPVLENWVNSNKQVGMGKLSDYLPYINKAKERDLNAIKSIEYTYLLHRIIDELIILWISMVNSGETQIDAIAKLTLAVVKIPPVETYSKIESIFDQLGAEQYLQSLLIEEINQQL